MTTLLLMGHGSRDPEALDEFRQLASMVGHAAPQYEVSTGWLEFACDGIPSLQEAIAACANRGNDRILAVPLLLHQAGHSKVDMPAEIARAQLRFPNLRISAAEYLSNEDTLIEVAADRIREAQAQFPRATKDLAVLLVGRGSTHPRANASFFAVGRLLWERERFPLVECCFVSLAPPDVPEGIARCLRLGAFRLLVVPYFINTGVLVKRIGEQAAAAQLLYKQAEIRVAEHLGIHPRLVEVILERASWLEGHLRRAVPGSGRGGYRLSHPVPELQGPTSDSLVGRYALPPEHIEALSLARVDAALGAGSGWSANEREIVRRMVYAAGDPSLAQSVKLHPRAAEAGVAALRAGAHIGVDVRMVEVGVDRKRADALGCQIACRIGDAQVEQTALAGRLPRAVVAIRALVQDHPDAIFVVGNSPTALLALLDLMDQGAARPRLIIGTPVGFVAAAEAKAELIARETPYIIVEGSRGGSAVAAAALNALLRLAAESPTYGR